MSAKYVSNQATIGKIFDWTYGLYYGNDSTSSYFKMTDFNGNVKTELQFNFSTGRIILLHYDNNGNEDVRKIFNSVN